eukprot:290179_1
MAADSAELCISKICELTVQQRAKEIRLITKIFSNLINNRNEERYKNLNFEKISKKLQSSNLFIDLLLIGGFVISPNQQRLYFDDSKMNDLLDINKLLQSKLNKLNKLNSNGNKKNEQSENEQKYSNYNNE